MNIVAGVLQRFSTPIKPVMRRKGKAQAKGVPSVVGQNKSLKNGVSSFSDKVFMMQESVQAHSSLHKQIAPMAPQELGAVLKQAQPATPLTEVYKRPRGFFQNITSALGLGRSPNKTTVPHSTNKTNPESVEASNLSWSIPVGRTVDIPADSETRGTKAGGSALGSVAGSTTATCGAAAASAARSSASAASTPVAGATTPVAGATTPATGAAGSGLSGEPLAAHAGAAADDADATAAAGTSDATGATPPADDAETKAAEAGTALGKQLAKEFLNKHYPNAWRNGLNPFEQQSVQDAVRRDLEDRIRQMQQLAGWTSNIAEQAVKAGQQAVDGLLQSLNQQAQKDQAKLQQEAATASSKPSSPSY